MKVVVTGATGYIGGAILERLITVPEVTSIVALSRRELSTRNPKVQTLILKDFHNYTSADLERLAGAEACIWCLGTPKDGKEVHMDMTMAAANAFAKSLMPQLSAGRSFKFVYTSGYVAERNQEKSLWFLGDMRRLRGEVENQVLALEKEHASSWKSFVARPAFVTNGVPIAGFLVPGLYIPKEELAAAMVEAAVHGVQKQILENVDLRQEGKAALARTS